MNTTKIIIQTSDISFWSDLKKENIPDLSVVKRMSFCDTADQLPSASTISTFVITVSTSVAVKIFSSWLYDRLKKKKPTYTNINNVDITNNHTEVNIVINNIVNESQSNDDGNTQDSKGASQQ